MPVGNLIGSQKQKENGAVSSCLQGEQFREDFGERELED